MKSKISVCVWLFLLGAFGCVYAAMVSSPKVEAVNIKGARLN